MRAIVYHTYGSPDVLKLEEVQKPTPKDNEALVRVHAASLNAADFEMLRGTWSARFGGLLKPRHKILGSDIAGRIEAVGRNVKQFHPGDGIWGDLSECGFGAFAEYVCVPENALRLKPASMTFEEAAAVPSAGVVALQNLRGVGSSSLSFLLSDKGHIQPGQKVLINGAGGGVGTFAVQLAKSFGAEVTGVDSTGKLDMLRSLGADHVIDYTQADFTANGETYDVIFDVMGKSSFSRTVRSLKPNGRYLLANAGLSQMVRGRWTSMISSKQVIVGAASEKAEDLNFLKELIEAGKIKPVIDRRYPLEQIAEAHRYVDTGHKKGNVVITVAHTHTDAWHGAS
jgi:NADPH:quinone reductase-like Zn-dependent oxidoreductase